MYKRQLQRLGHLLPQGLLRELAFTGRRLDAEEAERFGFVSSVEPSAEAALAAARALARTIAAKSPLAAAGVKRSLNYGRGRPIEEGLRDVAYWNAATLVSADLDEALRARRAKKEPRFGPLSE